MFGNEENKKKCIILLTKFSIFRTILWAKQVYYTVLKFYPRGFLMLAKNICLLLNTVNLSIYIVVCLDVFCLVCTYIYVYVLSNIVIVVCASLDKKNSMLVLVIVVLKTYWLIYKYANIHLPCDKPDYIIVAKEGRKKNIRKRKQTTEEKN